MTIFNKLELKLAKFFKKLPHISDITVETLVKIWPVLAFITGIFQLFAAWSLYEWARTTNELIGYADQLQAYGIDIAVSRWDFWTVSGFVLLVVDGILLLIAFPALQKRQKFGWNLILISSFLSLIYSIGALVLRYRGNLIEDVWSLIVTLIVFYLVFEIRPKYLSKKH